MFYNRLDNKIYSEIIDYADFNQVQKEEIKERVRRFHHWHRTTQLPLYSNLIKSVASEIEKSPSLTFETFESMASEVEFLAQKVNNCHPMMFSFDLIQGLDDKQVEQIRAHMLDEFAKYRKRFGDRTEEERFSRRKSKILVWLKRFKVDLNSEELGMLDESFNNQVDLAEQGFSLWENWDSNFYELLLSRHEASFEEETRAHIVYLESMMEENHPSEVERNRQIWREFFYQLALDEANTEKSAVPVVLTKLANNISSISENVPKSQLAWNAEEYCSL